MLRGNCSKQVFCFLFFAWNLDIHLPQKMSNRVFIHSSFSYWPHNQERGNSPAAPPKLYQSHGSLGNIPHGDCRICNFRSPRAGVQDFYMANQQDWAEANFCLHWAVFIHSKSTIYVIPHYLIGVSILFMCSAHTLQEIWLVTVYCLMGLLSSSVILVS